MQEMGGRPHGGWNSCCDHIRGDLWGDSAGPAAGQRVSQCRITDPTGTPLNVRQGPQGRIIGTIRNGAVVRIAAQARDHKGQPWVQIVDGDGRRSIGWVYREFVSCY